MLAGQAKVENLVNITRQLVDIENHFNNNNFCRWRPLSPGVISAQRVSLSSPSWTRRQRRRQCGRRAARLGLDSGGGAILDADPRGQEEAQP